jgi:hypothetical protein
MTQITSIQAGDATIPAPVKVKEGRRLRWRHLWLVPGLAIAIYANQLGNGNGVGILALIAFGIAPDVPRLLGSRGQSMHGLLHQPVVPAIAVAIAATGVVPIVWLVGALVWLSHVVIGRAFGDAPRPRARRSEG